MKEGVKVPTLSSDGWVVDPVRALDRLMAYFFESDKSQTYIYGDNISSLAWLYTTYSKDPENLAMEITRTLDQYLSRHYSHAQVSCRSETDKNNENFIELTLAVEVTTKEGRKVDLAKTIRGNNTKITEIINYLNG